MSFLYFVDTLVEKFRPDMRMLSNPLYALYEIHESGEERKLDDLERPLLVQLNWHSDDREGRFLLKRIDELVRGSFYVSLSNIVLNSQDVIYPSYMKSLFYCFFFLTKFIFSYKNLDE